MTTSSLLPIVDAGDFQELFIRKLYWNNPDRRQPLTVTVDDTSYGLTQVAGFKGLRVWVCDRAPSSTVQREIDLLIGKDSAEHLVIFCGTDHQDWRWPRRAQTGGVNAKLMMHRHVVGETDQHLDQQLQAVKIDLDRETTLVELLTRMRSAFDIESETESAKAARLMGTLYSELDASGLADNEATLLLARILFLLFGDDTNMWGPNQADLFMNYVDGHTTDGNLHQKLQDAFHIADTPTNPKGSRPDIPDAHPLARLPYINGGLFTQPLHLPALNHGFRSALLDAGAFDWSLISPAVFGSMFQTVKNKVARRAMGEHYTTETNILRTLRPLFLDELEERLERSWDDKGQLSRLLNALADIRVLDPACGCGNFLVVAYRELRAIELQALLRRRELDISDKVYARPSARSSDSPFQQVIDVSQHVSVTIDHFYGIEIEEWPARIAETAMLLVDHLANQRMEQEFGSSPNRLPIKIAPIIVHGNAIRTDWATVVPPTPNLVIVGNPPFVGYDDRTKAQKQDLENVWHTTRIGRLDYVTAWYAKASQLFGRNGYEGQFAFVSTNSVAQGEPVPLLFRPLFEEGWHIKFAHQTFWWTSEAPGPAASVHCVIIGMQKGKPSTPVLYTYPDPRGLPVPVVVRQCINAYLVDATNVIVDKTTRPISPLVRPVKNGSVAGDTTSGEENLGGLVMSIAEADEIRQTDPVAAKYLRPFIGGQDFLKGKYRYCLWMTDFQADDDARSIILSRRLANVRSVREKSTEESTRLIAKTPWLFKHIAQPESPYICIPRTVTLSRPYLAVGYMTPDYIVSNGSFWAEDPDGLVFSIISSAMFMAWQLAVGGRLKSDPRFANTLVWNTFPMPSVSRAVQKDLMQAGRDILSARDARSGASLADLYQPSAMSADLQNAHRTLDGIMDRAFGATSGCADNDERLRLLFRLYAKMTGQSVEEALF